MFGMGWIVVCGVCACVGAYLGVYGVQKVFVCVWMCAACDTCMIFVVCVHMCLFMPVVCKACVHVCMGVWHAWGLCGIQGVCAHECMWSKYMVCVVCVHMWCVFMCT